MTAPSDVASLLLSKSSFTAGTAHEQMLQPSLPLLLAPSLAHWCSRRLKQLFIVSVAQFRPEKDHRKQLQAFAEAKSRAGGSREPSAGGLMW
jgi:alpha-1,2-mannosyltransferase